MKAFDVIYDYVHKDFGFKGRASALLIASSVTEARKIINLRKCLKVSNIKITPSNVVVIRGATILGRI